MIEILAPAGNPDALERAAAAGADAVYLGCTRFSARAHAGNFNEEELIAAVRFCHLRGMKVHVTVNTLVLDDELADVCGLLEFLAAAHADAVLVQDLGILRMVRRRWPGLAVHASTQMSLHNASGARWARSVGIRRVVLARECPLSEIRLAAETGVEVEVFGHGAQCVSVSGQCLFSSMVGGRSGNRGACAQPCRMQYRCRGEEGAWLSPRDVCLRDDLPALAGAGACSVKLEGRLKRPEYVATVTASYRRAADSLADGSFRPADEDERRGLLQIFQRGGFMRGYAMGCEDAAVIDPSRVNHGGVPVGEVTRADGRFARLRVRLPLHDGDQLRVETGRGDYETLYAGPEVPAGGEALLRLRPEDGRQVHAGDPCVRLTDSEQLRQAMAIPMPAIPADFALTAVPGEKLRLTVTDGEVTAEALGDTVQEARQRALTADAARQQLSRTGGTAFVMRACAVDTHDAFVPVSALNALRRDALDALAEARIRAHDPAPAGSFPADDCVLPSSPVPSAVIVRCAAQLAGAPADMRVIWEPEVYTEDALRGGLRDMPAGTWLQLPVVCEEATLRMLARFAEDHRDVLGGVVLGSVGQLGIRWPAFFAAGAGIPVMNRRAAQFLFEQGCAFVTASPEMNREQLVILMAGDPPILVPAYGRTRLMLLHHCPARTRLGLTEGHSACRMCEQRHPDSLRGMTLTDRRGTSYPLMRTRLPEGCRVSLYNALPTDLRRETARYAWPQLWTLTDEPDCRRFPEETTSAHWRRGVEQTGG
ncbi:MAG: U32 family peptidase [Clostridia bacterium]|nr:U32 family peptidase [Clostridia bacterium]